MERKLLYRVNEAAEAIAVSRSKIYKMLADRELPAVRMHGSIRVPVGALERWIERNTSGGPLDRSAPSGTSGPV